MTRTPAWAAFWSVFRLVAAGLGVAAIVAQLVRTVSNAQNATTPYGSDVATVVANFFSFFTIQSNVLAAVTLTIGAVWYWVRGRNAIEEPRWFAVLLACASTYMIITGIVYNLLLRGYQLEPGATVAWSNEVLHVAIPVILLLDVLLAPKRRALSWRTVWIIVAYPIVWVVYTLLRANTVVNPANGNAWWYPYPFLNPHVQPNGYLGVAGWVAVISAMFIAVGFLVVWIGRARVAGRADAEVGDPRFTPRGDA